MPYWDLRSDAPPAALPMREDRGVWRLDDPATAYIFGGGPTYSGESVNETSALSLSAIYRAVSLISQGIAALPLKTYRTTADDQRERVSSFLDNPAGPDSLTPFEWKERVILHLLLHGNAFLYHVYTDGGAIVGTYPIHPDAVSVEEDWYEPEGKVFFVRTVDGTLERLTTREMTHILGPCVDGLRGYSFLSVGRNSLGISLAGERSAATMFKNGSQIAGVLTPRAGEDLSQEDATTIGRELDARLTGRENAGRIPLLNRVLEFQPWQMSNADAQWLESRQFQIEEICRWTGVPPYLLMQLEKQSSWGTGIAETNKNLGQYVFLSWCLRLTQRLSRLVTGEKRFCEFDMAGLEAGSAQDVSALLMSEVNGGLRTLNEARRILNLEPLPGGDQLRIPSGVMLQAQLEANVDATEAEADPATAPAEGVNA